MTQSVEALSTSGKIMDIAKELRGDMFLIANAIKKIQVSHIFVGRVLGLRSVVPNLGYDKISRDSSDIF